MIVYSQKIIKYIAEVQYAIKQILSREIGLKVNGSRFYDFSERVSYPIKVVIYNNKKMLGYFDPEFYELGFHESLMHCSKEQLLNIIRHELAHYVVYVQQGPSMSHHGTAFREFCQSKGWGEDVYRATTCIDDGRLVAEKVDSSILRKVQKLMALSTSSNSNEAEQAMLKSQELLLKHNIELQHIEGDDEKIFLKRILKQKKETAKMRSIALILETFFVNTVYIKTGNFIYLDISGSAVNIEIAEYVADFLDDEMDNLWELIKKQHVLKGLTAKNSFYLGIAKGYCNKVQALQQHYNADVGKGLMVIEKQLVDAKAMVYKRLTHSTSSAKYCHESSTLGEQAGRNLNIRPGLEKAPKNFGAYLT